MESDGRRAALGRLWRRRRLAPETRRLLSDVAVAEARAAVAPVVARARPIAGSRRWRRGRHRTTRGGRRRWFVSGPMTRSVHAQRDAHRVELERRLVTVGIESVHDEAAGRPTIVIGRSRRRDVIRALTASERGDRSAPWYVSTPAAPSPLALLDDSTATAALGGADTWALWRAYEITAHRLSGDETAVLVRFADPPTSGAAPAQRTRSVGDDTTPIDAVYTWVDDSDATWRAARAELRAAKGLPADELDDGIRFHSYDELRYSMRTLWQHADWFRRIYVVTSGQVPAWLVPDHRLRLVRHEDFMPVDALPTFNSHAIESRLHHIDGLAEHFVYFNDDVFIGRCVEPSTFFDVDGGHAPFVFPDAATFPGGEQPPGMYRAAATTTQIVERLTGQRDRRMLRHAPHALRRSTLDELEQLLPQDFHDVTRHQFRHEDDVSIAASLAPKWALATGRAVEGSVPIEYVSLGHPLATTRLRRLARTARIDFYCLNSSDADRMGVDGAWLTRWMQRLAPLPSPWERP